MPGCLALGIVQVNTLAVLTLAIQAPRLHVGFQPAAILLALLRALLPLGAGSGFLLARVGPGAACVFGRLLPVEPAFDSRLHGGAVGRLRNDRNPFLGCRAGRPVYVVYGAVGVGVFVDLACNRRSRARQGDEQGGGRQCHCDFLAHLADSVSL